MTGDATGSQRTRGRTAGHRVPPLAFGPIRSRRLGWSLAITNVPAKTYTNSYVYCQIGATDRARLERATFCEPDGVVNAVRDRLTGRDKEVRR